ncbi:MAG: hypothetical protein RTU30_14010 [Candidatus Thorarchaeota archaeon]
METKEFQAWRNGVYGHFEKILFRSLVEKRETVMVWRAPDVYFFTMYESILLEYSSIDTRTKLGERCGPFDSKEEQIRLGVNSEVLKSLVSKRLLEWHRIALWSCMAVFHGSYESVARELRYLVEDCVQSLHVDQKRPEDTIDEKLIWLTKNRLRGKPLINATNLVLDFKERLKTIYNELCNYVHPSVELIQSDIESRRIYFEYQEDWFDKMFELHTRVFDFVLALVMFRFPNAIKRFLEVQSTDELERDGYKDTIALIEHFGK